MDEAQPPTPTPFLKVKCQSSGMTRRFAMGTEAGFAVSLINKKLGAGDPLAVHIEAVKEGEEPISFGPSSALVDYGSGWRLQTVTQLDSPEFGGGEGVVRPMAMPVPAVTAKLSQLSSSISCRILQLNQNCILQPQHDASTTSSGVAIDSLLDTTNEFITDEVFKNREELVNWIRVQGRSCGVGVVIKRSDAAGKNRLQRARINLCCEHSGYYTKKSDVDSDGQAAMSFNADIDHRKRKRPKATGTKKCGCPFLLKGVNIGPGDEWKLEVVCGVHNHPFRGGCLEGQSYLGTEEYVEFE
ncbi:uncharacterized protein LOC126600097 isoform X2 [Malus sylvestris]|uniref:uncharacterized protein LOC126600097 isoform X2 n=1 Tax=Malus sylvestris TaxID=3752 RepID=UPI0021ABE862|nr:uncharacterized protein LOC126600097 isoform X2 [Malus sylvestris]